MNSYVLWGFHPRYHNPAGRVEPLKIHAGSLTECRQAMAYRERDERWHLAIYRKGDAPVGLRVHCNLIHGDPRG